MQTQPRSSCALRNRASTGESPTLEEASPRMMSRGLQGARLAMRRHLGGRPRAKSMRCVGTWHAPGLPIEEFTARHPSVHVRAWRRSAGTGLDVAEPAWIPDVTADDNFPRAAVAERVGLHAAFALPIMQGRRVQGVMEFFSRDIREPSPRSADDDDDDLQPDRPVHRAEMGQRRSRPLLHALTRSVLRRHVRRLLPPGESGVADRPRSFRGRAPSHRRSSNSSIPTTVGNHSRAVDAGHRGASSSTSRTGIERKDGSYKWLAVVRRRPSSTQGLVYAAARDITERKAAEDALTSQRA